MRTKVKAVAREVTLARMLVALEQELIDATDIEIKEAAQDLGMNLDMKGSAAFSGLRYPAKFRFDEHFGQGSLERLKEIANARRREHDDEQALPRPKHEDDDGKKN